MLNSDNQIDDLEDDYCKHCHEEEAECKCGIETCADCHEEIDNCECIWCPDCRENQPCSCG